MGTGDTPEIADPVKAALARANNWYTTAAGLIDLGNRARTYWRQWRNYTVTITSSDPAYQDVQDWMLANVPTERQRALAVRTERFPDDDDYETSPPISIGRTESPRRLSITYDSTREQRISIDGRDVWISLDKGEQGDGKAFGRKPDQIVFRCTSKAAQQVVVDHLQRIVTGRKKAQRKPQMFMMAPWGSWAHRADVPPRTAESVVRREGQMETLIADLGAFLDREAEYGRRAIPWHRGYLLQGPPGTGKTSLAKALANHFGLDLYYAPLGDMQKDTNLLNLVGELRPRSVLLLEDIDIYHAATSRSAEAERVSLSGLLNALDGVATPHGLITILTSNDPKVLDDALVRPGRIDRVEDVDYLDHNQARRLFTYFYGHAPRRNWTVDEQTPAAALTEIFKRHMDDSDGAERALQPQYEGIGT